MPPSLAPRAIEARLRDLAQSRSHEAMRSELSGMAPADAPTAAIAQHGWRALAALQDPAAEAWLDRALELAPANATLHRAKGVLHQKRREWPQAISRLRTAADLRPDVASIVGGLGNCLFLASDHAQAAAELRRALELDATQRGWWLRLARALTHLGRRAEAIDAYERALALAEDPIVRSAAEELRRQLAGSATSASASYYDDVYRVSAKYAAPAEKSAYMPVWRRIVERLSALRTHRIVDLGCGPGQFAEFLVASLHDVDYVGIDFSEVAIAQARRRCPGLCFEVGTLPIADFSSLASMDAVLCMEVLEHVENDCEVLASIPAAATVIATVPDFDSFGHLRTFADEPAVRTRYESVLEEMRIEPVQLTSAATIWIITGRARS